MTPEFSIASFLPQGLLDLNHAFLTGPLLADRLGSMGNTKRNLSSEEKKTAFNLDMAVHYFIARERLEGRKTTQEQIADTIGISQAALSQYLRGAMPIGEKFLLRICSILGEDPKKISPALADDFDRRSKAWQSFEKGTTPMRIAELLGNAEKAIPRIPRADAVRGSDLKKSRDQKGSTRRLQRG